MTHQERGRAGGRLSAAARLSDALDDIHAEIGGLSEVQAKQVLRLVLRTKQLEYVKGYRAGERRVALRAGQPVQERLA